MAPITSPRPNLPIEIVEKIIGAVWHLPLSSAERITFMTSSTLVSKTWSTLYSQVAFKNVHIPSLGYARYFHNILDDQSSIFHPTTHAMPRDHCLSLTFHIEQPCTLPPPPEGEERRLDNSHSALDLLDWLADIPYLPLLRRVSINCVNCSYTDIFDSMRLAAFPKEVTHLEISYSFDSSTPLSTIDALQRQMPIPLPGSLPLGYVTRLSVFGTGISPTLAFLILSCDGLRVVESDLCPSGKPTLDEKDYLDALIGFCAERGLQLMLSKDDVKLG